MSENKKELVIEMPVHHFIAAVSTPTILTMVTVAILSNLSPESTGCPDIDGAVSGAYDRGYKQGDKDGSQALEACDSALDVTEKQLQQKQKTLEVYRNSDCRP